MEDSQALGSFGFASESDEEVALTRSRRELLEALDRVVAYQHYYHSVYGRYTKVLSRIGLRIPFHIRQAYEIQVIEANPDRLLLNAFSEVNGRTADRVSINQDYTVHANFEIPDPSSQFLKAQAYRHIRALRDAPHGQLIAEQGVFKGYFRYDVERDSNDRKIVSAKGIKAPVAGTVLELGPGQEISDLSWTLIPELAPDYLPAVGVIEALGGHSVKTGQNNGPNPDEDVWDQLAAGEASLARKIFLGETGRNPKNWAELVQVANFRPLDKSEEIENEFLPSGGAGRVGFREPSRSLSSVTETGKPLEFEPIRADE